MEIYQIKSLDCRNMSDRKRLLDEVKKVLKRDEKPSKESLEKISRSVGEKYKMPVALVKQNSDYLLVSVAIEGGAFSTFRCYSYYEALCKHILLVQAFKKYYELKVK